MTTTSRQTVSIDYFSDILCVWAYIAQIRLDQLRQDFADQIDIRCHYISVFGDVHNKIANNWQDRGGFEGYRQHLDQITRQYDFISLHPDTWKHTRPYSSMSCHLFLKAIERLQELHQISCTPIPECHNRSLFEEAAWQMRLAFFRDGRDIGRLDEQQRIAAQLALPGEDIQQLLDSGEAYALLSNDYDLKEQMMVTGSPTFVLNEGRQKLYGNIGYRIIEANIHELLETPTDQASWC
jgi:predicted DsbA family dithiol-disulfide isomerase